MGKMPWLKLYTEIRTDPKMQALSDAEFRVWINLLCLAAESKVRGVICIDQGVPYPDEALARAMYTDPDTLKGALAKFIKLRMVEIDDDGIIYLINFDARQYDKPSDRPEAVRDRVRKHREKKKTADPVVQRDGYRCRYCGKEIEDISEIHIDHIIPISQGGLDVPENKVVACRDCNLKKGARTPEEAGMELLPLESGVTKRVCNALDKEEEKDKERDNNPPKSPQGDVLPPPSDAKAKAEAERRAVQEVFEHYCRVIKPVKLTEKRKAKIKARLADFTVDELKRAIDNLARDPWIMGDNERGKFYATIEYVFRSTEKTEEWINKFDGRKGVKLNGQDRQPPRASPSTDAGAGVDLNKFLWKGT